MQALAQASPVARPSVGEAGGGLRRALAASTPALLYGVRLSASVCLALVVAFWLQLENPHWAATSAGIVAQPALGASLRKGRFRAIGTLIGGVFIVLLTAAFPQDHVGFLLSLTLWAAVCGYLATMLPNFAGYSAALAGYTAAIVFGGITEDPENVFLVAVWRTTEIGIGIFSAGLVHSLTDLGDARRRLSEALTQIGTGIASGLCETLRSAEETLVLRTGRRALIGRVIALDATIDEAIGEPSHVRHQRGRLQAAMEALFVALSGWRGIGSHLAMSRLASTARCLPLLLPPLVKLADRDWLTNPEEIRALCGNESRAIQGRGAGELSSRLLVDGVIQVLQALEVVADTLLAMTRPGSRPHAGTRNPLSAPDFLPPLVDALRIVLALTVAELIWLATSWPHGPIMITFTAVNAILSARVADAAYARAVDFALGCHIAAILAVVMDLAVLPLVHGGALALSLALTAVLLPLGALSAGSWRKMVFVAAVSNFMPILALENEPSYDAARLFDTVLAVSAGTLIAAIFFRLLPPVPPQRRIERLLRFTLQDLRDLAAGRRAFARGAWLNLLSARLAAMPQQASLEQQAELLATLSVGEASIALLAAQCAGTSPDTAGLAAVDLLECAFASLAAGKIAEARAAFIRLAASQSEPLPSRGQPRVDIAVHATLIADALARHEPFFARMA